MLSTPQRASRRARDALDIKRCQANVETGIEAATIGNSLDVAKARLAGIAPLGRDPIDFVGCSIGAGLDPAVPLLEGGFGHEFGSRSGRELVLDIGFHRRLVAFEGE
jgi:hypothetical protein